MSVKYKARKKLVSDATLQAVLATIQSSDKPLDIRQLWQRTHVNGERITTINTIQKAAKILEGQGLIKIIRTKGYSLYASALITRNPPRRS